ncbi:hypothetical protein BDV97DRAFT_365832 [Delphinella strobiligena]|nr:hypothetical protein BDV97DRAFT_365832 [Delphinella strobiligena]
MSNDLLVPLLIAVLGTAALCIGAYFLNKYARSRAARKAILDQRAQEFAHYHNYTARQSAAYASNPIELQPRPASVRPFSSSDRPDSLAFFGPMGPQPYVTPPPPPPPPPLPPPLPPPPSSSRNKPMGMFFPVKIPKVAPYSSHPHPMRANRAEQIEIWGEDEASKYDVWSNERVDVEAPPPVYGDSTSGPIYGAGLAWRDAHDLDEMR